MTTEEKCKGPNRIRKQKYEGKTKNNNYNSSIAK